MSSDCHFSTLLAIDTSTSYLSLGIYHQGQISAVYELAANQQSDLILPAIGRLLAQAGLTLAEVEAVVYAQGPGAFTGLRIGLGVAQGLAAARALPLIGIPCLDAVAALQPAQPCVLAATDARMGELFYAWYNTQTNTLLSDYAVGRAEDIRLPAGMATGVGVGNAFALPGLSLPVPGSDAMPEAVHYLQRALSGRYQAVDAAQAELVYVRNKIALTAAEQAKRKDLS